MTGQQILKRFETMDDGARGNWLNLWQECADWCWPTNDNINRIRVQGVEKPPNRMIDTAIEANFTFASGLFSHLFPPNTVWARYRHPHPEMMTKDGVADYFEEVSRIIHQVLIGSNFSQEEFQALIAMGCFGTNCISLEECDKEIVKFRNFVVSNIRMDVNYLGNVDTVAREIKLTARQAIQQFGLEELKAAGLEHLEEEANSGKNAEHSFIHWVCPREDYDQSRLDAKNKEIASIYVSKVTGEIVKDSGFDEFNPYKIGRFTVGNNEVYGRGPMSMVLGTTRRTNVIYRSMIVSAEQHANPQWLTPDDDSVKGLSARAGAVIQYRHSNPNGKPERLPPNGDPGIAHDMYELHDAQIKKMFFNHLFRPLEDYRNMTAYEAKERMTTDMMMLSPFVSRYIDEHVTPLMNHVYYICQKRRLLPKPPAALDESPNFEIDYVGRLSLATKSFETMGAINTIRIFAELAQADPRLAKSLDYVDGDKLMKEVWYTESSSMNALKADDDVALEREAREKQIAQQQAVENAPKVADSVQKLSGEVSPNSVLAQIEKGE